MSPTPTMIDPGDPWWLIPPTLIGGVDEKEFSVATKVGSLYQVTFDWHVWGNYFGTGTFTALWGSTTMVSVQTDGAIGSFGLWLPGHADQTTMYFSQSLDGTCQSGICDDWGIVGQVFNLSVREVVPVPFTATPEPATILLMATGLLGCVIIVRRKRRME
jgi:hypothetical protein